jgi:formylglycine-generating enzyme required for sulfatase activity
MSAGLGVYHDETEVSYAVDFGRDREPTEKRSRYPEYRRKGSAPARVNGMHCRRNKRWTWGSGRGARMQNVRAFAGCLAFAVASLAVNAFGVTIDYRFISNPGNSANTNGWGAVSEVFKMAATETTNAQYVAFLNSVDAAGNQPNGIYNASMGSSSNGGITFNAAAQSGAKYSVKAGTNPAGSEYGSAPVTFVNWFSAARFANWLNNGATSSSSTETGAYTLNGQTSGAIVARNPGATVFLPSRDEWYKAAFYDGSAYKTWGTNSNTTPNNTVTNVSLANAANFGGAATPSVGPLAVGSYTASLSAYGLYDMVGNLTEMTDTINSGNTSQYQQFSGNWQVSTANMPQWNSSAAARFALGTNGSGALGFRVAAVPEPGTIALAGMGIAGLAGLDWMKRRKKRLAARQAA